MTSTRAWATWSTAVYLDRKEGAKMLRQAGWQAGRKEGKQAGVNEGRK